MREFFKSKKNVIVLSLIIAIFAAIAGFASLSINQSSQNTQQLNDNATFTGLDGGINAFSSTPKASNCTIHYDEQSAKQHIYDSLKSNFNNTQISVTFDAYAYFKSKNISQSRINDLLLTKYNNVANGTCSLVAITIITKLIMEYSTYIDLNYPSYYTEKELEISIFKELHDISISLGNKYSGSRTLGTFSSTIDSIIRTYFSRHGYNNEVTENHIISESVENVRDSLKDVLLVPSILSFNTYYNKDIYSSGGHSVAVVGVYQYKVTYKKKYNLFKTIKKDICAYVICNGWSDASNGMIGDNLQLLVLEDDANAIWESHIIDWDYEKD